MLISLSYPAPRLCPDLALGQFADLISSIPSDTNTTATSVMADDVPQKLCPSGHRSEHRSPYTDSADDAVEFHPCPA